MEMSGENPLKPRLRFEVLHEFGRVRVGRLLAQPESAAERHRFYFGNLDPARIVANRVFEAELTPAGTALRVEARSVVFLRMIRAILPMAAENRTPVQKTLPIWKRLTLKAK